MAMMAELRGHTLAAHILAVKAGKWTGKEVEKHLGLRTGPVNRTGAEGGLASGLHRNMM